VRRLADETRDSARDRRAPRCFTSDRRCAATLFIPRRKSSGEIANDFGCPPILVEGSELPEDGGPIDEWLAALPDAAASYVHHAIAGASADDVAELRELIQADDDALDALYAPEPVALADHDPAEAMYEVMSTLTPAAQQRRGQRRPRELAFGSQHAVQEHAWERRSGWACARGSRASPCSAREAAHA
jgi:hypothetical protein